MSAKNVREFFTSAVFWVGITRFVVITTVRGLTILGTTNSGLNFFSPEVLVPAAVTGALSFTLHVTWDWYSKKLDKWAEKKIWFINMSYVYDGLLNVAMWFGLEGVSRLSDDPSVETKTWDRTAKGIATNIFLGTLCETQMIRIMGALKDHALELADPNRRRRVEIAWEAWKFLMIVVVTIPQHLAMTDGYVLHGFVGSGVQSIFFILAVQLGAKTIFDIARDPKPYVAHVGKWAIKRAREITHSMALQAHLAIEPFMQLVGRSWKACGMTKHWQENYGSYGSE